ncbi:MAG: cellulose synthase operon protein YhjQ [Gammaproteobacteria bacterium]|nr:cellulose synthase operon protein YhjQ [Gammaproteobacteria bacterium]
MFVTAFLSAQGGVGRTSISANLAAILASRGRTVVVIEWDPANRLAFHLGSSQPPERGWIQSAVESGPWHEAALENSDGVLFLPFGAPAEQPRRALEQMLAAEPSWLARRLETLDLASDAHVMLDVSRGPSVYVDQALVAADLAIGVLRPFPTFALDVAVLDTAAQRIRELYYLLNQVDTTRRLTRDILLILRSQLEERLLRFAIHRDESVPEALAANASVATYAPASQAGHDLQGLASWLIGHAAERTMGAAA